MKSAIIALAVLALGLPGIAPAQGTDHDSHHPAAAKAAAASGTLADGEIRRVDRDASKITIRHGPIANLDMPPMTMVFQVKDAALLDKAKPGDKVRFSAEKAGGQYVVTRIEPAQ